MPTYNKLVRDLIPKIIEETGKTPEVAFLNDKHYQQALRNKLQEEVAEYLEAEGNVEAVEELADVIEVVAALARQHGASMEDVEKVRQEKVFNRGSFNDKLFLVRVEDE
ncbi:nucleoside triphosphate pyrophosphohydrolase [Halobacillus sp. K22]|uniref:nucleoside triphosphate pyrophosphohydrolase n=1 Tax=Halobacillus sp. K22 TaxID=3457431 RepID=UPI003FCD53F2